MLPYEILIKFTSDIENIHSNKTNLNKNKKIIKIKNKIFKILENSENLKRLRFDTIKRKLEKNLNFNKERKEKENNFLKNKLILEEHFRKNNNLRNRNFDFLISRFERKKIERKIAPSLMPIACKLEFELKKLKFKNHDFHR